MLPYNKNLKTNARALRTEMTPEESHLWYDFLKKLPMNVYRQHTIGKYIVDFYIASRKLVIEIDGAQHQMAENKEADAKRDAYFQSLGISVKRYGNRDINRNFRAVCVDLLKTVEIAANEKKK